jgi:protein ImuB
MLSVSFSVEHNLPSPPLRGRVGEGGNHEHGVCGLPPSLTLPRKGGGNAPDARLTWIP